MNNHTAHKWAFVEVPSDPNLRDEARIIRLFGSRAEAVERLEQERADYGEEGARDYHVAHVQCVADSFGEVADWFVEQSPETQFAEAWTRWCDHSPCQREAAANEEECEEYETLLAIRHAIVPHPIGDRWALVAWADEDEDEPAVQPDAVPGELLSHVIANADRNKLLIELAKRDDVKAYDISPSGFVHGATEAAAEKYAEEGRIEIDDDAIHSVGDDGVYVSAWVFVSNEEIENHE